MHLLRGRWACLLAFMLALAALCTPAFAVGGQEEAVKTSVEAFLKNYNQEAMLYEETDQRIGTVASPQIAFQGDEVFWVNGKHAGLASLQENIQFVEKKAAFYAAMRKMQNIYRQDFSVSYTYTSLKIDGGSARVSLKEAATFYYTDSARRSVYETIYTVDLVNHMGFWLVADITDGSRFDTLYKKESDFDLEGVLAGFSAGLNTETAVVQYPYTPNQGASAGRILYNGKNAAAYASTYCRQNAGVERSYYNSQFKSYAGIGGDCMNFTSQCLWAGFGGNQAVSAINGLSLPMDTKGANTWYGRGKSSKVKDSSIRNWISCSGFWSYLKGSNAASDTGMYATVISVSGNSPITGVSPEELVGAAAHVEGAGGSYSHAILFTAATGNSRSQIWFSCHTKDVAHLKLGDYYFGPIRVYIPRYMRVNAGQKPAIQPERSAPVLANTNGTVGFRTEAPYSQLSVAVQAPDGTRTHAGLAKEAAACLAEYRFTQPGLYRVDCVASNSAKAAQTLTYYVRCVESGIRDLNAGPSAPAVAPELIPPQPVVPELTPPDTPPEETGPVPPATAPEGAESAATGTTPETGTTVPLEPETETPDVPFPDMPTVELDPALLQPAA